MSEEKWPKCQTTAPEVINVWRIAELEAERDALRAENAQLRDVLADRDMDREMAARSKLELIEANRQLDALRARIENAPVAMLSEGPAGRGYVKAHLARTNTVAPAIGKRVAAAPPIGKRVALVPLGGDE